MEPKAITAKAVQDTALAALRIASILVGGLTVLFGLVAKRDLAGLIAWVQSEGFVVFTGAALSAGSLLWGLWKTYDRSHQLSTAKTALDDTAGGPGGPGGVGGTGGQGGTGGAGGAGGHLSPLWAIPVLMAFFVLAGCTTIGNVQLNAGKAFYTAQVAFKSAQQSTLIVCTDPAPRLLVPCRDAVGILGAGAQAEAAGFAAQQAGNAGDLQTAVTALMDIPPRLAALGILEN